MIRAQARRAAKAIVKATSARSELGRTIAAIDVKRAHQESKGKTFPPQRIVVERKAKVYAPKKRTDRDPSSPDCYRGDGGRGFQMTVVPPLMGWLIHRLDVRLGHAEEKNAVREEEVQCTDAGGGLLALRSEERAPGFFGRALRGVREAWGRGRATHRRQGR